MNFRQIKQLSELPENELTAKLVGLAQWILRYHDANKGLSPFDWYNLQISDDGSLYLTDVSETVLTEEVRERNFFNYAAIIYCICTRRKSADSMPQDAVRIIRQPVLREIVGTICERNLTIFPLIKKLREPYVDEESFFKDYSTENERKASEDYERVGRASYGSDGASSGKKWYSGIGVFVLMALCYGGYKAYKANERMKKEVATECARQQMEEIRQTREDIRSLPRVTPKQWRVTPDSTANPVKSEKSEEQ